MHPESPFKPTILVTGATGFLGGALAADLLAKPEWESVLLLVRAEDLSHAYQRVLRSLARFTSDIELLGGLKPEKVLAGDFTQPGALSPRGLQSFGARNPLPCCG